MAGYIQKLRDLLTKKRAKLAKRPNGVVSAFVLGSGCPGAPKCVYLHTDIDRYLFNCGEGSQRLAQELKLKLRRVTNIFLTHASWENLAGLPGVAMALRDVAVDRVTVWAPKDVSSVLRNARSFVRLRDLDVNMRICEEGHSFEDRTVRVVFAPISGGPNGNERAACYVVLPKERRRVLDPARCQELNVPKGPLWATLKSGGEVQLEDRVVTSEMVTSPAAPGFVMLVVDAPSRSFIPSLRESSVLAEYSNASCVIHLSPLEVMRDPEYSSWMTGAVNESAVHILVNDAAIYGAGKVAAVQQMLLAELLPDVFPRLANSTVRQAEYAGDRVAASSSPSGFNGTVPRPIGPEPWRQGFGNAAAKLVAARPLLEYRLAPPAGFNETRCPELNIQEEYNEVKRKLAKASPSTKDNLDYGARMARRSSAKYPIVIFTGTGGSVPSPMRNTAGIFIKFREDSIVMLDCAEGTYGQLLRLLGPSETARFLVTLKGAFISHPHADHTLGLPTLLRERSSAARLHRNATSLLQLLAPAETHAWLSQCVADGYLPDGLYSRLDNERMRGGAQAMDYLGAQQVQVGLMDHCPGAFAISITEGDKKLTYSGDTAPNNELVEIGRSSFVLVNEATLGTVLPGLARNKRHCTTAQALELASQMQARNTILTHFSTRYARVPQLMDLADARRRRASVAFDNMIVEAPFLDVLPDLIEPLSQIYAEYNNKMRRKERRQY